MTPLRFLALPLAFACGLLFAACSDDGATTTADKGGSNLDGFVQPDGVTPQPDGPQPDGPQPDGPAVDLPPASASALSAVMNKLYMPTSSSEYARDLDGDGNPDNRLGAILGVLVLAAPTMNLQGSVDTQIDGGALLLLFDVLAKSLGDDAAMQLVITQGQDEDVPPNPADNFSGTEEFSVAATGSGIIKVAGKITGGKLEADGAVQFAIPLSGTPAVVNLKKGHVEADVSASGMINGRVNGAIPQTEVDGVLIPAVAQMMNDPKIDPAVKTLFDTDKNGTVEAAELKNNPLIALLLGPDVDTDNDKVKDALSVGIAFTAVPCKIKPY